MTWTIMLHDMGSSAYDLCEPMQILDRRRYGSYSVTYIEHYEFAIYHLKKVTLYR